MVGQLCSEGIYVPVLVACNSALTSEVQFLKQMAKVVAESGLMPFKWLVAEIALRLDERLESLVAFLARDRRDGRRSGSRRKMQRTAEANRTGLLDPVNLCLSALAQAEARRD